MPDGGTLTIETENTILDQRQDDAGAIPLPPGSYVRLTMRDSGVGMDAETLARAFEPFFTTKPHGKGSGLGLATVYGIVKQSFGDIQATSVLGAGSLFTILLPVAHRAVAAWTRRADRTTSAASSARLVAYCSSKTMTAFANSRSRCSRAPAMSSAPRAAASTRSSSFAVRPYDGWRRDRRDHAGDGRTRAGGTPPVRQPDLPVLYITGYTDDSRMLGELQTAGARLLEKPFTASALAEAVASLGEHWRKRAERARRSLG